MAVGKRWFPARAVTLPANVSGLPYPLPEEACCAEADAVQRAAAAQGVPVRRPRRAGVAREWRASESVESDACPAADRGLDLRPADGELHGLRRRERSFCALIC